MRSTEQGFYMEEELREPTGLSSVREEDRVSGETLAG